MRILLLDPLPDNDGLSVAGAADLLETLSTHGHEARRLSADQVIPPQGASSPSQGGWQPRFHEWTDRELSGYREEWRKSLDREIAQFNPQLIHVRGLWLHATLALETGVPYLVTATGPELAAGREDLRGQRLVEQGAQNAGAIAATSEFVRRELLATFQHLPAVVVQPEPVSPPRDNPDDSNPLRERLAALPQVEGRPGRVVVACADLESSEGFDTLLNAAAIYEAACQATTVILGAGPQGEELQWLANRIGLQRIHWGGTVGRRERTAWLACADLLVSPSQTGLHTRAAEEALATGVPVVAADAGAMPEIVDSHVGAIVPPDDHERLAEAICRLLNDDCRRRLGRSCQRRIAERCGPDAVARNYGDLYRGVLFARHGVG